MIGLTIVIVVLGVALVLFFVAGYNRLVTLRNRARNAWSQIDVQLKRRHDLIPNLVETVKGYMAHEREVLEGVTKARQQAISATGVAATAEAENALTHSLRSLFAVAESYPQLRASENMRNLQEELSSTENKIAFARQFYNDQVMGYNTATEQVPWSTLASMYGFKPMELFEIEDVKEREVPRVAF
ncbi:MAG: LemA family protein [Chthonomonadales bacterium]|nr:LemA family protein [Chthonomonadales bacterium]